MKSYCKLLPKMFYFILHSAKDSAGLMIQIQNDMRCVNDDSMFMVCANHPLLIQINAYSSFDMQTKV